MSRFPILASPPWSAACLAWAQRGARWLTIAVKHVAWIDPEGRLLAQSPRPVRLADELAPGGLVSPAEIVPRTPCTEIFVTGRMPAAAGGHPRHGRLRVTRGGSSIVDVAQPVPPELGFAPFVPPALAPLARRFPVRARWLAGRDPGPIDAPSPDLPPDIDLRYFVAAPAGLQVDALRAGDRFDLEGLVAGRPAQSFVVPADVPWIFARERGAIVETLSPSLAALAIDLEQSLVTRIFRWVVSLDGRALEDFVVSGEANAQAPSGGSTALVDASVVAALRALPFASAFDPKRAPAAPAAPTPDASSTAAIDGDMLAQLRAAYRDGTPFQGTATRTPAAATPRSLDDTPFRKASLSEPRMPPPPAPPPPAPPPPAPPPPALPPPASPPPAAFPPAPAPARHPVPSAAPATLRRPFVPVVAASPARPVFEEPPAPPPAAPIGATGAVDPDELRALREAHATPFRELRPTERKAPRAPAPASSAPPAGSAPSGGLGATGSVPSEVVAALRAQHAPVPFRRKSSAPLEPFSTSWAESFLLALKALEEVAAR